MTIKTYDYQRTAWNLEDLLPSTDAAVVDAAVDDLKRAVEAVEKGT